MREGRERDRKRAGQAERGQGRQRELSKLGEVRGKDVGRNRDIGRNKASL